MQKLSVVLVTVFFCLFLHPVASEAAVPVSYCDARAKQVLVKNYLRGVNRTYSLNCGLGTAYSGWGFRHIKHRWNATFDYNIALTFLYGARVDDVQQDGGRYIYARFDSRCREVFRIIYDNRPDAYKKMAQVGIITAYYSNESIAASGPVVLQATNSAATNSAVSPWRTDCRIIQRV